MGRKTLSLREETYHRLDRRRREDESFSDVIDRLLGARDHPIYGLIGLLDEDAVADLRERSRSFRGSVDSRMGEGTYG